MNWYWFIWNLGSILLIHYIWFVLGLAFILIFEIMTIEFICIVWSFVFIEYLCYVLDWFISLCFVDILIGYIALNTGCIIINRIVLLRAILESLMIFDVWVILISIITYSKVFLFDWEVPMQVPWEHKRY